MKTCTKCKIAKPLNRFTTCRRNADGKAYDCKDCRNAYMKEYGKTDKYSAYKKDYWKNASPERKARLVANSKRWHEKSGEYLKEFDRQRYPSRKPYHIAATALKKARRLQATPKWADNKKITMIYAFAKYMDEINPFVKHHVDHIIPLQNKNVCGLHVETNLQILDAQANLKKSNTFKTY